jgi:hypothetical protein
MALPVHRSHTDVAGEFGRLTQQLSRLFDEEWAALPAALGGEGFTPSSAESANRWSGRAGYVGRPGCGGASCSR